MNAVMTFLFWLSRLLQPDLRVEIYGTHIRVVGVESSLLGQSVAAMPGVWFSSDPLYRWLDAGSPFTYLGHEYIIEGTSIRPIDGMGHPDFPRLLREHLLEE
jgi:hypothetical protein